MTSSDDRRQTLLRNMMLGQWASEKLHLSGKDAEAYSDALARCALDPERNDVFKKIRDDFDAAGVAQTDEEILGVMTELMIKAGNQMPTRKGSSVDAASMALKRNLTSK